MKNSIWIPIEYKDHYLDFKPTGISLRFCDEEIDNELRKYLIAFCRWLRERFWFPIKCKICIDYYTYYKDLDNRSKDALSIFYYPRIDDQGYLLAYPRINIAVASYKKQIKKHSRDEVFSHYSGLLSHELTHYFQWCLSETDKRTKRSLEIEANKWAEYLTNEYGQGDVYLDRKRL